MFNPRDLHHVSPIEGQRGCLMLLVSEPSSCILLVPGKSSGIPAPSSRPRRLSAPTQLRLRSSRWAFGAPVDGIGPIGPIGLTESIGLLMGGGVHFLKDLWYGPVGTRTSLEPGILGIVDGCITTARDELARGIAGPASVGHHRWMVCQSSVSSSMHCFTAHIAQKVF